MIEIFAAIGAVTVIVVLALIVLFATGIIKVRYE